MENNRLNINRPLLSVRRRAVNDDRKKESCIPVRHSVDSCTTESTADLLMNTGSVPFGWEQSPGRPKNKQVQTIESAPSLPKLPPGRFLNPMKNDPVNNGLKITKSESIESTKKESFDSRDHDLHAVDGDDDDDDEDNDEAYVDALDTLSRGETSFYNCSASGVSGVGSDVKPFGVTDPKVRDFMMGRFLPAAKAMASELPQHTFKKNIIKEKPQEIKKFVNIDDNNKMKLRYGPNFLQDVVHDKEEEAHTDDDDDSDYDYSEHGNKASKLCGLIPRFCSVNPVHGMCVRARLPVSPAKKTQTSSSSSNSFRDTESEPARNAIYKHRSLDNIMRNESSETSSLEGLKLYNRLQGNGNSVDVSGSFQSTVSEQSDSSSKKKGVSFKELLADKNTNETETDSQESIIEKTLYVDTVHIIKSPQENTSLSCIKPQFIYNESLKSDMFVDESKHDLETKKFEDPEVGLEVIDDINGDKQLKAYEGKLFELPVPPPLPKSPSDSWLGRTLPSVSSKNAHMRWNNRYPPSSMMANDPKTDEKVRLRNPQGQLNSIPES
ncbi:hypothetical protein HanXRQr2_Chr17g0824061 [Helianthus annuus]|nr:uncharacterized protein LOC110921116 [Helianthus annuus]XP_035842830.1 uncharacterized protein LOC110921116 [Helianthus annuus]KAF5757226.1 hypothetical protein HanXRQr2_Chr17g0824061 [Helianthus annuus]